MKARYLSLGTLAIIAMACIQDPEAPSNLPDAPKLTVDETSVTRVSMVVNGSFGKNMTDVTAYGVEVSETLFEDGGTYTTLVPQDVSASGFSVGVSNLKSNGTYFLRAFISNGHSKMYSSTITQKTPETSVASISDVTLKDNYYLVATIEDNGGRSIEDVGFMWGTSSERKSIKREKRYPGTLSEDGKTFTLPLSEVGEGTHYIMAYAEDDKDGTGYSRIPYEFVLKGEDEAQIEDPEFKKYLVMYHDLNQDGKISYAEIKQIETIDVHTDNIRSVREIEQMPLRSLMVSGMQEGSGKLTSLIVKKDTLVRFMDCSNNQLKELDASMIPDLEYLNCEGNPMETLYLSYYQKFNELRYPQGCRIVYVDKPDEPQGQPNTEIWYTTTDGKVVDPDIYNIGFGAEIVSNKYEDGKGVITFNQPVTRIGYYAFAGKSTLATISIPGSVTVIDEGAFTNCSALAWPDIPESVTRIGDSAFFGCEAFTRVAIPETVTEFGYSIFQTCPNLASITSRFASADNRCLIVNGVLNAFAYAGLGEEYVFPQNVSVVGANALRNSAYNGALSFAGSLISVEKEAFAYAYYIKSIDFGSNLESVGEGSFVMCGADTLTLPASLTSIGADAFAAGFDKLTFLSTTPPTASGLMFETQYLKDFNFPVYVPAESVQAYKTAEYWSNYADRIQSMDGEQPNNEIWYTSRDGNVVEPYKTDVFGANIVSNTYSNGKGIILFDGNVTSVGEFAFNDCKQLTAMWLPSTVTSIGSAAFQSCNLLEKLDVQEGLTVIGEFAFGNCTRFWDIELPQSLETIEDSAFSGCAITSVTFPEGFTALGTGVFMQCDKLEHFYGKFASDDGRCVIVDNGVRAFAPAGLTSYSVPEGVERIDDAAFYYCSKLTSLTVPEGVTYLGDYAFTYCSSLTSFHVPSTVTYFGGNMFSHCNALERFTGKFASDDHRCLVMEGALNKLIAFAPAGLTAYSVPDGVNTIGSAFFYCTELKEIFLPESVYSINDGAFFRCMGLEMVMGGMNVQEIGSEAFRYCNSLPSIELSSSIMSIGRYAFADCTSLVEFKVVADTPPTLGENAFNQDDNLTIYVPSASLASYKNSWSAYADRIQPIGGDTASGGNEGTSEEEWN